jgi:Zn ribbon nucleic-acid-binding protein
MSSHINRLNCPHCGTERQLLRTVWIEETLSFTGRCFECGYSYDIGFATLKEVNEWRKELYDQDVGGDLIHYTPLKELPPQNEDFVTRKEEELWKQ